MTEMVGVEEGNNPNTPLEAIQKARKIWLSSTSQSELDEVELLYRWALSSKSTSDIHSEDNNNSNGPPKKKKTKRGHCGLERSDYISASEKFALLLCQSGRCKKAKKGLASIGYTCRLAKCVLDYPEESTRESGDNSNQVKEASPCTIVDNFLTK